MTRIWGCYRPASFGEQRLLVGVKTRPFDKYSAELEFQDKIQVIRVSSHKASKVVVFNRGSLTFVNTWSCKKGRVWWHPAP